MATSGASPTRLRLPVATWGSGGCQLWPGDGGRWVVAGTQVGRCRLAGGTGGGGGWGTELLLSQGLST